MENQETKEATTETQPAGKGLGSFKRNRPPAPEKVNEEVAENLEYFRSFTKSGAPETEVHSRDGANPEYKETGAQESGDRKQERRSSDSASERNQTVAKQARADFPQDGTSYTFRWEKRLQRDWDTLQLSWKNEDLRTSAREFMIVATMEAMKMSKEMFKKSLEEAYKKYGVG